MSSFFLHMYVCMYDNEILEFFVCICVENQSVGTLLFHYFILRRERVCLLFCDGTGL